MINIKAFILKRPLFTACSVAFAICALCSYLTAAAMVALAVAIIFAFLFILPFKTELKIPALIIAVASVLIIVSNALYYTFCYKPATSYLGTQAAVECEVLEISQTAVTVRCNKITRNGKTDNVSFKAGLIINDMPAVLPSGKLSVTVQFYDKAFRTDGDGIHIKGIAGDVTVLSAFEPGSPRYILYSIREKIKSIMPFKSDATAAFVNGMIFGDVSQISGVFNNKLNNVGLSHVTSVSGMHLAFSVLLIDLALSLFAVGPKPRAFMAIASILVFTFLSGFAVSCIRAAIMLIIYYIGVLNSKISDSITSLSVAAYLILLFAPNNISSLSFLLSASATFGIIFYMPCLNSLFKFNIKNRFLRAFVYGALGLLTMSLSACVCCLPITAVVFEQFCVLSPVVNVLLAIPIQLLFYIGVLSVFFGALPYVGTAFSFVGDILYNIIEFVVSKCYYIKNTTVTAGFSLYYVLLALILVLALGIYILHKSKRRLIVYYVGGFMALCLVIFGINQLVSRGKSYVHFADVGDGNCSVITKDEQAVIVDCGGDYFNEIERILCYDNVKRISLVAITHFNADHVNYLQTLLNTYDVDCVVYPAFADVGSCADTLTNASYGGTKVIPLKTDEEFLPLNNIKIRCFVERAEKVKPYDNKSAVYRVEIDDSSVLYTGDMNIYQEHAYLAYSGAMNCNILSVAHHGSKTSSTTDFLNLCSPDYSVISAAKSSADHPNSIIVERLKSISTVVSTASSSTVTFQFNQKGYKRIK